MTSNISTSDENTRSILDGMVDGVITINDKGEILTFNKSAENIFGYSLDEAVGQNVSFLMPEPVSSQHDSYIERYVATENAHIIGIGREVVAQRKNGECFPMRLSVVEYPSKVTGERWFIGTCIDITLYKEKEEQLRRSQKMDALGKLISGIVHDFNNTLGVILGFSELLEEKCLSDQLSQKYLNNIQQACLKGTDLSKKLLSLTRSIPVAEEIIGINDVLKENNFMLEKTLTAKIELNMQLEESLWSVYINKGCLEDAILNMSINAMHAMPEGGSLEIRTSNIKVGTIDSQVLNINEGDYVKMSIADNGIGMTSDIVSHIFDPFFTTKEEGGTGLGLSQVYSFVHRSGGSIRVYSEPGHGTCFSIYLPRYNEQRSNVESGESGQLSVEEYQGAGNILVVDDQPSLRVFIGTVLKDHGYYVFPASGGKQALSILEKEDIDLVLSDVIMPEMDGFELAHIIQHQYPGIKIQLCSGFSEVQGKTVTNTQLYNNLLQKPFTSEELLKCIDNLLKT